MVNSKVIEVQGIGPVLFERSRRAKHISISIKPFFGVRVAIPVRSSFREAEEFTHAKTDWLRKHLGKIKQYEKEKKIISEASLNIRGPEARQKLTERLNFLAAKHGFTYNRVFIRDQKTRWGSCSHKNNISLNIKLLALPEELMDYVILHELAHTRVMNHSAAFWAELDKLVGNGKRLAARLREYGLGRY